MPNTRNAGLIRTQASIRTCMSNFGSNPFSNRQLSLQGREKSELYLLSFPDIRPNLIRLLYIFDPHISMLMIFWYFLKLLLWQNLKFPVLNRFQFLLGILGNIPESLSPIHYSHLVPFKPVNPHRNAISSNERDWSDFEFVRQTLVKDPAIDDMVSLRAL